jgi:hypothetical protein
MEPMFVAFVFLNGKFDLGYLKRICVIDGQGGGIGATMIKYLKTEFRENVETIALGTNAIATAQMLKAGANKGASGENAICRTVANADFIIFDGKPVPYAEVEVEFYNRDKKAQAPTDYMVTQTIKADQNGVFTYAVPKAGWWGFAALNEADYNLKTKTGEEKGVELGAVIWVHFEDWMGSR